MKYRGKLGTRRTLIDTRFDVNVDAIPFLEPGYQLIGVEELSIGGDAPKDFIVFPCSERFGRAYIAKAPSRIERGPLECVTEYLIASIGRTLPLRVAEGRLVRLPSRGRDQKPDVRFLSRYFLRDHESLLHGVELVAKSFEMDEEEVRREIPRRKADERSFYTLDLVTDVLESVCENRDERDHAHAAFARMMAFDALIGCNDRHARNWGMIESALKRGPAVFSPVYDTARGLFWNHRDHQLARKSSRASRRSFIETYANNSSPLIGLRNNPQANHFDVISEMVHDSRAAFCVRQIVEAFDPSACARMLHQRFDRLLSRMRLEYIDALLRFRHAKLKLICDT